MSYTNFSYSLVKKGFEQTRKTIGTVPISFATRLIRKDAHAARATRLLTGSLNAENISKILIPSNVSNEEGLLRVEEVMSHLSNFDFINDIVSHLWPSPTQRLDVRDQMLQPTLIAEGVRRAGVNDDEVAYAITDVICSMLARTGMVANAKPMSGIIINDDENIEIEDIRREALMQAVETAFEEVTLPINFDTEKLRPNVIAQYIAEKAELIYDALRGVSSNVKMVSDAFAVMRISMEEYAANGQILDESIRTYPALTSMMKDITLHRIARDYENTSPGCDLSFYNSRLSQLENLIKRSKRFEQVTPKRSVSHITVDRIANAKGMITDVMVMAHAKPASDVTIAHYLPRDNAERLHSLKVEIEETQTVQHYVEQVVNGGVTDRTRRVAVSLLSSNTINREDAEEVTIHLMGGVNVDDIISLAIMNSTNLYLSGVRDLNDFDPEIIYHKVMDVDNALASNVAQPEGRVITTGNPQVMLGYAAEQDLVEAKDYSREGFASELTESNILGQLEHYTYRDLNRTRNYEITAMNGKLYKSKLDFYTLLTTKVPHNQALLRCAYAEGYLAMHINVVKGVYEFVERNFKDRGKTTLDLHLAQFLFGYFEDVMRDTGTYNLVKSVGYDLVADVTDRSERATFFHELFEGDYYGQTAFAVIAFILLRTHRLDGDTWNWVKDRFEETAFWTHHSQSIIRSARGGK